MNSSGNATIPVADFEAPQLHPRHAEWIEARGISAELARKFGLTTVQKDGKAWLSVPYVERGRTVNHKYRLISEKRHQMDQGGRLCLWNHDCLLEDSKKPVVICEGEWDALVAISVGYPRAVSVPNGASGGEGELSYLWDARELLNRENMTFIVATDSDEAGIKLRSNIVQHLGADRCSFVDYGADCKDLNETLLTYGKDAAREVLDNAKPFPVQGLYTIDDFPERPELTVWPTGVEVLDDRGEGPALYIVPGTLTVFTGHANTGKSTFMDCVVASLLKRGIPTCLASFETDVKPILLNDLRRAMLGCGPADLRNADTSACDAIIREKLHIISQQVDEIDELTVEDFLDLCRTSVLRRGTRVVIVDPWNELEHKMRPGENETMYIGRALRAIKRFAKLYDVAFWIIAHPTKPFEGKVRMPRLLDISGSANWANKADFGLSYHRADEHAADLCVTKVRKGYPGRRGNVRVQYDWRISAFTGVE